MAVMINNANQRKIGIFVPTAGESVFYTLKVPSRERYQKYLDAAAVEGAIMSNIDSDLFDEHLVAIDNMEHEDGTPATPEKDKGIIPDTHKQRCLLQIITHGALNGADKAEEVKKP